MSHLSNLQEENKYFVRDTVSQSLQFLSTQQLTKLKNKNKGLWGLYLQIKK